MADYFDAPVAVNPDATSVENLLVANALFEVFAVTDTARETPLTVYEALSGATITELRSSVVGQLPQFSVEGDPEEVVLKSGSFETRVKSAHGMRGEHGKTAFEYAAEFGFEGTESEFGEALAQAPSMTVGGGVNEAGQLVLYTAAGGEVPTGITQPTDGVDGVDGTNGADGLIVELQEGDGVEIDSSDPARPIISATGKINDLVAGTNISINKTDPANPVISATGGGSAGGNGSGGIWFVKWNGTTWVNPTPTAGLEIFERRFLSGGVSAPVYTGPSIPGVEDFYATNV